jgi:hypothetical protein
VVRQQLVRQQLVDGELGLVATLKGENGKGSVAGPAPSAVCRAGWMVPSGLRRGRTLRTG